MEWLNKIPNWIKIPIEVLLPALTIFSGLLLFLGDGAIEALHMIKFGENSGFSFGLRGGDSVHFYRYDKFFIPLGGKAKRTRNGRT